MFPLPLNDIHVHDNFHQSKDDTFVYNEPLHNHMQRHPQVSDPDHILKITDPYHIKPEPGEDDDVSRNSKTRLVAHKTDETSENERQQWSRPIEFLLSCISMSVGLGNVWRFPMTAYENGGGAFLIPYLVVLIFIGRPLYFMELALGQFSSSGSVKVWKMVPAVKGLGYGQMVATWSVVTYYCSLMALTVFYLTQSFSAVLPWTYCDPAWADLNCVDAASNRTFTNESQSSSEQYFLNYVLHRTDNIDEGIGVPDWRQALCLLLSWSILFVTLIRGVQSSGKVAYFTALFPYLVLLTLLARGASLPGAAAGVLYFIKPQWRKLLDPNVWYAAVTQSFFSLSVGFGSVITFSSYNDFKHNIYRDAWIISLVDTLTSMLAGVTIFSILGSLAHELGTDVKDVVRGGSGLAFISYPEALGKFDWAPQVFAVLFFLMMFTLGLGTASALTGNIITIICDQFPSWRKAYVTLGICIISFLVGLVYVTPGGQWILDLVDYFGGGFVIYVLVIIETIAVHYIYGVNNFLHDVKFMLGKDLGIYWRFCWSFFIPFSLAAILIYILTDLQLPTFEGQEYPQIAYTCGWILSGVALVMVPVWFCQAVYITDGETFSEKMKAVFVAKTGWGPRKAYHKDGWLIMKETLQSQEDKILRNDISDTRTV
ncbi:sodium-dependent nutrient amino acid transporter 1-like [Homarus americanus]|uniref:Sodium-dependent nutrient amino acid transporter 1 n=1 Tax=Homarus americanus TaxID=6706 RepID=A0A8J5JQ76_HOMAM|nr:sodium-dependent nutrient amino acid transporter 1-like [Homarus americanus]KAG7162061.1 Sodium-dependent nutrient amino acid transporter 1-like 4 [Homarus americanus]